MALPDDRQGDRLTVEAQPLRADVERADRLARRQAPEVGHAHLDDEPAAGPQVGGDVPKARDLLVLARQSS